MEDLLFVFMVISIFMPVWVYFGIPILRLRFLLEQYRELQTNSLQLAIWSKTNWLGTPLPDNKSSMIQGAFVQVYGEWFYWLDWGDVFQDDTYS